MDLSVSMFCSYPKTGCTSPKTLYVSLCYGHRSHSIFDGPAKPDACWSGRSEELCEELIFTVTVSMTTKT